MGGTSSHTMAAAAPLPVVMKATAKHTATVIFLHGLGDTGQGWSSAFAMIRQPHIKYICPTAREMPVSLNAGFRMPSWFDIYGLSDDSKEDEVGIKSAAKELQNLISEEEKQGIARNRIIIGGFSQGGAVALYAAFTDNATPNLGGILGLSTWLPLHKKIQYKGNLETPILQCHGKIDPLVSYSIGEKTAQAIQVHNKKLEFKSYAELGHSSCEQEMLDVKIFINQCLPSV